MQYRLVAFSNSMLVSDTQNSLSNLPDLIKGSLNPFSLNAYQNVTALIPRMGVPIIGSSFSRQLNYGILPTGKDLNIL